MLLNCWSIRALEKTLESSLDCKIKPVHPKGNQPWIFIGKTDAETPVLWSPVAKSQLTGKDLGTGKCWRQEEKGAGDRRWDGWMASSTQLTWVWVNSRRWWRTGNPGVLQFMGLQNVRQDWETSLSLFTFMHWRRKWQPTPVFLPGESQARGSLVGWSHRVRHDWSDLAAAAAAASQCS